MSNNTSSIISGISQAAANLYHKARIEVLRGRTAWRSIGNDLQMQIDPNDSMDRLFYLGTYDRWLKMVIRKSVKVGDLCVDVGAHKGYVTLQLARAVGPSGRVFSFEPDVRARVLLEQNCTRNRLENVRIFPYALGSSNGDAEFALSRQLGWSSLFPNAQVASTMIEKMTVPVRRFDDLVRTGEIDFHRSHFSFLKVDSEGSEYHVLSGMETVLTTHAPLLWMEINWASLAVAGTDPEETEDLLVRYGYSLYEIERAKTIFLSPRLRVCPRQHVTSFDKTNVRDILAIKRLDINRAPFLS